MAAMNGPLPERLTGAPVKAHERLNLFLLVGGGDENLVLPDARRRVAATWDLRLPDDVFRRTPTNRWIRIRAVVVVRRAAPAGPAFRDSLFSRFFSRRCGRQSRWIASLSGCWSSAAHERQKAHQQWQFE